MWRYLFLAVPKVDLIDSRAGLQHSLMRFITRRLMPCRTTSITEFRLRCKQFPEAHLAHLWLTALVFRNVQVLDISSQRTYGVSRCSLSKLHLAWESLEVLKLHGQCFKFKLPESVMFPKLKVLNLRYVELRSLPLDSPPYRFSDKVFPQLEDLRLDHLEYDGGWPLLYVTLSTLKRLAVATVDMTVQLTLIDIHSPQLQHLELQINGTDSNTEIYMCNFDSIVSVYFVQFDQRGTRFTDFLCKVNNVKELDLSEWAAEGLEDCDPLPLFPNLIHLKIGTPAKQLLWDVLQNSPNLEALDIKVYTDKDYLDPTLPTHTFGGCCPHPENVPGCFGSSLAEIGPVH